MEERELFTILTKELKKLKMLKIELISNLEGAPEGTLQITGMNESPQFYHHTKANPKIYIPKNNKELVNQLAQKSYDQKVLALVQKRIFHCQRLMKDYESTISSYYNLLADNRKNHIKPIVLDDSSFVKEWYLKNPGMQNSYPQANSYLTNRGEYVRSKSEKIIADMFDRSHIPYIYEPRIQLTKNTYKCADFLVLNIRTRKTYIYEHFGMVDHEEYANKMVQKMDEYSSANIILGDNLLITLESS